MSKLADAIRRSQRVESKPMGFGSARPAQRPTMLVGLFSKDSGEIGKAKEAGADIVLLDFHGKDAKAEDVKTGTPDLVIGVDGKLRSGDGLNAAGVDFVALEAAETPASMLLDEALGYVLYVDPGAEDAYLRSLDGLNLDAVIIETPKLPLTIEDQIDLTRVAGLTRQPLIVAVEPSVTKEDLQCLRSAGVAVVLTDTADRVKQLKEAVVSLPPRRTNRDDQRTVVSLPRGTAAPAPDDDDDDE